MDELHHECGVAALYHLPGRGDKSPVWTGDPDQVSRLMPRMLLDLQNRGQLAAGHGHLQPRPRQAPRHVQGDRHRHRGVPPQPPGEVRQRSWRSTPGRAAIGHVRYATCGADRPQLRPAVRAAARLQVEVVRVRVQRPARQLRRTPRPAPDQTDYHLDARQRHRSHHALPRPRAARRRPARPGRGVPPASARSSTGRTTSSSSTRWATWSCSATRSGFRPLCYAQDGPLFAAASESVALLEPRLPRHPVARAGRDDPHPGRRGPRSSGSPSRAQTAHCFFEWIYFANVASTLDDRSVYLSPVARSGKELAQQEQRAGPGAARRRTRSWCRCRHRQGGGRRDGVRAGHAVASRG